MRFSVRGEADASMGKPAAPSALAEEPLGAPIRKRSVWARASSGYGGESFYRKLMKPAMT